MGAYPPLAVSIAEEKNLNSELNYFSVLLSSYAQKEKIRLPSGVCYMWLWIT